MHLVSAALVVAVIVACAETIAFMNQFLTPTCRHPLVAVKRWREAAFPSHTLTMPCAPTHPSDQLCSAVAVPHGREQGHSAHAGTDHAAEQVRDSFSLWRVISFPPSLPAASRRQVAGGAGDAVRRSISVACCATCVADVWRSVPLCCAASSQTGDFRGLKLWQA